MIWAAAIFVALVLLCITGRIKSGTWVQKAMLGIDMFVCLLIWGRFDVTISSRCGLALEQSQDSLWADLGDVLNWISPGHCTQAIVGDIERADAALLVLGTNAPL